ncbi:hypothetical protein WH47_00301 [Habropoda laboriosa]|uniref:Uncharacterized protein n=1 Tax=Habropoda laboriosa TaxID=597456 RepID=A0A0L7R1T8_9HYME|nr:hypothetical protein WH47_00301 [Habropoda laboriosa]
MDEEAGKARQARQPGVRYSTRGMAVRGFSSRNVGERRKSGSRSGGALALRAAFVRCSCEMRECSSEKCAGRWVVSIQRCLWLCRGKVAVRHSEESRTPPWRPQGRRPSNTERFYLQSGHGKLKLAFTKRLQPRESCNRRVQLRSTGEESLVRGSSSPVAQSSELLERREKLARRGQESRSQRSSEATCPPPSLKEWIPALSESACALGEPLSRPRSFCALERTACITKQLLCSACQVLVFGILQEQRRSLEIEKLRGNNNKCLDKIEAPRHETLEKKNFRSKGRRLHNPELRDKLTGFREDDLAATFFPPTEARARTIEANFSVAAGEERRRYLESGISSASAGCRGGLKIEGNRSERNTLCNGGTERQKSGREEEKKAAGEGKVKGQTTPYAALAVESSPPLLRLTSPRA